MKFTNQIKAYIILHIMIIMMMHNAFPHVHHQHEESSAAISEGEFHHHDHHDSHHHHLEEGDNDNKENDNKQKSFLDYLFNNHLHTQHTHQYTSSIVEQVKPVKGIESKWFANSVNWNLNFSCFDLGIHRYVLSEDLKPEHHYLHSHPHRGPPALG